jgi:hypothetical protein
VSIKMASDFFGLFFYLLVMGGLGPVDTPRRS